MTREEILAAARRLFGERGDAGTSVRTITAEAGVNQGLVHLRDLVERVLLTRLAAATGGSPLVVSAAAAQVAGVLLLRYVVRVEPLASATEEEVVAVIAPVIQRCPPGPADRPRQAGGQSEPPS